MSMRNALCLLIFVSFIIRGQEGTPYRIKQERSGVATYYTVSAPESMFRDDQLTQLCKRLISDGGNARLVIAQISIEGESAIPYVTHVRYAYYRSMAIKGRNAAYGLLISIGGDGVLLIARPNKVVTRTVIQGMDPTEIRSADCTGEILYIGAGYRGKLAVFTRVDAGQKPESCFAALSKRLSPAGIAVWMRNDPWFFGAGTVFPVVYLFTREPVPEYREWIGTRTTLCEATENSSPCREYSLTLKE